MKKKIASLFAIMLLSAGSVQAGEEASALVTESQKLTKTFMEQLKGHLVTAMKSGGPIQAIEACHLMAPQVAADMAKQSGWTIGRTSLKPRNQANTPDDWERVVLEDFEKRIQTGEGPEKLEHHAIVTENGKQVYRYMKAIMTAEKPCLTCHGSDLDAGVAKKIAELYPNDQAKGYKAGTIRGAFTFKKVMD
ncbi:MAG: DUF3365 domain-containing protein [Nitrospirae bacterium]|nr:DUF3365 domain-containing protein [Magnetococcales bacterium]HAT50955.1 hypothetical protein [Alphaproteobacteria bacterium]